MNQKFMKLETIAEMFFLTGAGWIVSLNEIEAIARIISLIVPTVLSILLFVRRKNKNK